MIKTAIYADDYIKLLGEISSQEERDEWLHHAHRYRDDRKVTFGTFPEASDFIKEHIMSQVENISDDEKVLGDITQKGISQVEAYYDHDNRRRIFRTKEAAAQWIKDEAKRDGRYVTKEPAARIIANDEKITGATIKLKDSYKAIRFTGKEEERVFASEAKALAWLQPDPIEQFIAWIAENNVVLCIKTSRGYSPLTEHGLKLALTAYREDIK